MFYWRLILACSFLMIGILHFTHVDVFAVIVPPFLPAPRKLVYLSGIFEVLGGIGLLMPAFRRAAAFGLLCLIIAVYPANIYMAVAEVQLPGLPPMPAWAAWARLPLQFVFLWAVWWTGIRHEPDTSTND